MVLPLLSRKFRWFGVNSTPFVMGRAFAAGVVLSTGFVHMFPGAQNALTSTCLGWGSAFQARCGIVRHLGCTINGSNAVITDSSHMEIGG